MCEHVCADTCVRAHVCGRVCPDARVWARMHARVRVLRACAREGIEGALGFVTSSQERASPFTAYA